MDEQNYQENRSQEEQIREKAEEMQEKLNHGINKAMSSTAESLDKAADRMHEVSNFFRNKSADTIKDDMTDIVKKYPTQTLIGALLLGFIFGKAIR